MRIFSGIRASGAKTLGNYSGGFRQYAATQEQGEAFFCIVDLHSITTPFEPGELREATLDLAALLFATGLDPDRSTVFVQSHVTAHPEAAWLLSAVTSFGELRRMTQFKDRAAEQDFVSAGLFTYPVLMAGDILLYQTDLVPVGDDQRQHVELTRDIAERFNQRFGQTFVVPEVSIPEDGARIKNLQEPERLMSTTRGAPQGVVRIVDPPETIRKKFKTAVTDSGSDVRHDPKEKAGISNLIEIMTVATGELDSRDRGALRRPGLRAVQAGRGRGGRRAADPDPAALRGAARGRVTAQIDARRRCREGPRGFRTHARTDVRAHGLCPALSGIRFRTGVTNWTAGRRSFRFGSRTSETTREGSMKGRVRTLAVVLAVVGISAAAVLGATATHRPERDEADSSCRASAQRRLRGRRSAGYRHRVKHVVYLIFDNVHFLRDNPNVPSDLEQMPHLLNFIRGNGTLLTNDHTVLISHTGNGILTSLTGMYSDRHGQAVANSYRYFKNDGSGTTNSSSSFKYWTDLTDDVNTPADSTRTTTWSTADSGIAKNAPAPWVPYTRAGCDWGATALANVVLENTGTGPAGDMTKVFGSGSPEWNEAVASNAAPTGTAARNLAQTDFVGLAIHCAQNRSSICPGTRTRRPTRYPTSRAATTATRGSSAASTSTRRSARPTRRTARTRRPTGSPR